MTSASNSTPWQQMLDTGAVRHIGPAPVARWLRVDGGSAWLTQTQSERDAHPDHWVEAGAAIELPAHSDWLLQADGSLRYLLIEPAGAAFSAPRVWAALWRGGLTASRRRLQRAVQRLALTSSATPA